MATNNKDFKVKHGLIVEGAQGTINNQRILTEVDGDAYILSIAGGGGTSENTPNTLVKRDGSGNFAASNVIVENQLVIDGAGSISNDDDTFKIQTEESDFDVFANDISLNAGDDFRVEADDLIRFTSDSGVIHLNATDAYFGDMENPANRIATEGYVDTAEQDAKDYADTVSNTALTDAQNYTNTEITAALGTAQGYADTAEQDAKDYADGLAVNYDAAGAAATAQSNAEDYTDTAIGTEVTNRNNAIATAKSEAISAAEDYTDTAVGNIVGAAPELLDTLQELAAALENNPDIIADLQDVAAGKQDTLTAGDNISIDGSSVISVTGLDTADVAEDASFLYFTNQRALDATSAAYDIAGAAQTAYNNAVSDAAFDATSKANTAQDNANDYTDQEISSEVTNRNNAITSAIDALNTDAIEEGATNLYFTDGRAKASAGDLLAGAEKENIQITYTGGVLSITAENGVGDSTTDELEEGETNLYFLNSRAVDALEAVVPNFTAVEINSVAKHVAATTTIANASQVTAYEFLGTEYRSAKFLVKTAQGSHTDVAEVLLTMDSSNNISITEYAMVGTNGSLMTITADYVEVGTTVRLRVTTANNTSVVTVVGTLLA